MIFDRMNQHNLYLKFLEDLKDIVYLTEFVPFSVVDKDGIENNGVYEVKLSISNYEDVKKQALLNNFYSKNKDANISIDIDIISGKVGDLDSYQSIVLKDAINLPVYEKTGMKVNGLRSQFINEFTVAKGWQVERKDSVIITFRPKRGAILNLQLDSTGQKKKLVVKMKKNNNYSKSGDNKILFSHLLKAFSNTTNDEELRDRIASGSFSSFTVVPKIEEMRKPDAEISTNLTELKKKVLQLFFYGVRDNLTSFEVDSLFENRLIKSGRFDMSPAMLNRLKFFFSFSNRCMNRILAEKLRLSDGSILENGTILTKEICDKIQDSDITSIHVNTENGITRIVSLPITEKFDENHLINIANIYCCELDRVQTVNDLDSTENKSISNCYTILSEYSQIYLDKIFECVSKNIINKGELQLSEEDFKNLHFNFSDELGPDSFITNVRNINPRNTLALSIPENQVTSNIKNASNSAIEIKDIARGFFDSPASPESKKTGITQNLASTAFTNKYGELCNTYIKLKDGLPTKEKVDMNIIEAYNCKIVSELYKSPNDVVHYMYQGKSIKGHARDAEFCYITPSAISSRWASCGVGFEHNKSRRTLMAENQNNQYHMILGAERRMFTSGISSTFTAYVYRCDEIVKELCLVNAVGFKEELLEKGISLVSIAKGIENITYTFKSNDMSLKETVQKTVDYMATINQLLWSYELNTSIRPELKWYNNEIVIKPIDVSTEPAEISELSKTNYGGIESDDMKTMVKELDLAMGLHLLTASMSLHGTSYEDGTCIRQGLIDSMRLANIFSHKIVYELKEGDVLGKYNSNKLKENGLPKENTFFYDNETIIEYTNTPKLTASEKMLGVSKKSKQKKVLVPEGASGFVQDTAILSGKFGRKKVVITIASLRQFNISDKLTGHHGDKGVTTYIVPDSEMPTLADGTPIDICLNPLGIPSRMNMGVLVDGKGLAYSLVQQEQKEKNNVIIKAPFDNTVDLVNNIDDIIGSSEEVLYDPLTLKPFPNKVTVCYRYMLKLDHNVEKKIAAISSPHGVDTKTNQPKKSKFFKGGQSLSELGLISILSNGATKVADYLLGAGSDDIKNATLMEKELMTKGKSNILGDNRSNTLTLAYISALGLNVEGNSNNGISINLATDKDIANMSIGTNLTRELDVRYLIQNNPVMYEKEKRTGKLKRPSKRTFTHLNCGNIAWVNPMILHQNLISNFAVESSHGTKLMSDDTIRKILSGDLVVNIEFGKKSYTDENGEEVYYTIPFIENYNRLSPEDLARLNTEGGYYTGALAIYMIFANTTKQDYITFFNTIIRACEENTSEKSLAKIKEVEKKIVALNNMPETSELITNKLLVLPLGYRFISEDGTMEDDMNGVYRFLVNRLKRMRVPDENMLDGKAVEFLNVEFIRQYNDFYITLFELCTKDHFTMSKINTNKKQYRTIINFISDKEVGSTRGHVFSKKIRYSFRSVIVGRPECKLNEFFMPVKIAFETYKHKIFYWLKNDDATKDIFGDMEDYKVFEYIEYFKDKRIVNLAEVEGMSYDDVLEIYELVYSMVNRRLKDELCILVREPALLKYNTQAFIPRLWEEFAIGINTLICEGYNADFDGDQEAGYALLSEVAKENARLHLTPDNLVRGEQSGEASFNMKMDVVLGFNAATRKEPDASNIVREYNVEDLIFDFEHRLVYANQTIHLVNKEPEIDCITTVGRAYASIMLPKNKGLIFNSDTNKNDLAISYAINSSNLKTICSWYFDESEIEQIDHYDKIKLLGFKLQDLENTSLGLDDFSKIYRSKEYQEVIQRFNEGTFDNKLEVLELNVLQGFVVDEIKERNNFLAHKEKSIMKAIDETLEDDSNLSKILTSGARASKKSFLDTLIQTGYVKGVGDKFANSPIMTPLYEGYKPDEYYTSGNESRRSTVATMKGTADSGELNRIYGFDMGDEVIGEDDCGAKPQKHKLLLLLDLASIDLANDLYGKCVDPEYPESKLFGTKNLDTNCIEVIQDNLIKELHFTDGSSIKFNYLIKNDSYSLYVNRYGYVVNEDGSIDTSKEVELKHEDIDKYLEKGHTHIYVRMTWDCKGVNNLCKKCYGRKISDGKKTYIGYRVGMLSSTTVSQTMVQLALDTKNIRSDAEESLSVNTRLKSIVTLQKSKQKDKYIGQAIYTNSRQMVKVNPEKGTVYVNGELIKGVPKSAMLVDSNIYEPNICVVNGSVNYNTSNKHMPIEKIRELMFEEFFRLYESNGISLHPKHFEIVVLAQTKFAEVTKSSTDKVSVGSFMSKNYLDSLIEQGLDIEYKPCATSIHESCLAAGWTKAMSYNYVFNNLTNAVKFGYRDLCNSTYSSIALGKSLSGEVESSLTLKMDRFTKHLDKLKTIDEESQIESEKIKENDLKITNNFQTVKEEIKEEQVNNDGLFRMFKKLENLENKGEDDEEVTLTKTSFF